jgi:hypothetical protein
MDSNKRPPLCPSSRCEEEAQLLGFVQEETVTFVDHNIRVDEDFIRDAPLGYKPETLFRFANTCQGKRCAQWTGQECGVIGRILRQIDVTETITTSNELPKCGIRSNCRWYDQEGAKACKVCYMIITERA